MSAGRMIGIGVVLALVLVNAGGAQSVRRRTLPPPVGVLDHHFSFITSIRELSDGRVLVTDPREGPVMVADFASQRVTPVGRIGSGPGEYQAVTTLTALGGDSTVMVDLSRRRWTIFALDKVVGTLPPETPIVGRLTEFPFSGSRAGNFLSRARFLAPTDSTAVILVPWNGSRQDTIVRLAPPLPGHERFPPPFPVQYDGFAILADGWVVVRRVDPYRVDWRSPTGSWRRGPAIPYPVVPVTDREKAFYLQRRSAEGRSPPPGIKLEWPETVPPVEVSSPMLQAPDGTVLVRRYPTADAPGTTYDVINRQGMREYQLVLPASERVVGFGSALVYVTVTDEDGLQRLQRHPWR